MTSAQLRPHIKQGKIEKKTSPAHREGTLSEITTSDSIAILLRSYNRKMMMPTMLGKVYCNPGEHFVKPGEVHAAYRGLSICRDCNEALGYAQMDRKAREEAGHGE